jgi:hypothetical protein
VDGVAFTAAPTDPIASGNCNTKAHVMVGSSRWQFAHPITHFDICGPTMVSADPAHQPTSADHLVEGKLGLATLMAHCWQAANCRRYK